MEPPPGPLPHLPVPTPAGGSGYEEAAAAAAGSKTRDGLEDLPPVASGWHEDGSEWVEMRPRWPLTSERHPRSVTTDHLLSAKRARVFTSLTDMTKLELEALAAAARPI